MSTASTATPVVYQVLARVNNSAADNALLAALPRLTWPYSDLAIHTLVHRSRPRTLAELVAGFNKYPPDVQSALLAHTAALEPALRIAVQHPDVRARTGALQFIVQSGDFELAYLLAEALAQTCPTTRERAALGLQELAERRAASRAPDPDPAKSSPSDLEESHLAEALERGLRSWEVHRRPEVLRGAGWCIDLVEPTLSTLVEEHRSTLPKALDGLLLPPADARLAGFTLWALAFPPLRDAAGRLIGRCDDPAFMLALFEQSWSLRLEALRKASLRVRELTWLCQSLDPLLAVRGWRARAAVRFVGAVGLPHDAKATLLAQLAACPNTDLARAAVAQLILLRTEAADMALRRFASGRDASLAATVRAALARRRRPVEGTNTPPAPILDTAVTPPPEAPPTPKQQFDRLFEGAQGAQATTDANAVKDALRSSSEATRTLRAKLASADPEIRARALHLARGADWIEPLENEIYRLAHDPEAGVRASAVAALGGIATPTSMRVLRNALQDPDSRVQANAVEALDQLEANRYETFIADKLGSSCSRVRANAVKALLKWGVRRAADTLIEMLESSDRGERLSALWVVEQLHLGHLADDVHRLARADPDQAVRSSAERIAHALEAGPGPTSSVPVPGASNSPVVSGKSKT